MDFRVHRPNGYVGRSERALRKITTDLTNFLTKAQRSLTFDTLSLSSRHCGTFAHILVEFAEDLYQDIGIWRALEYYNLDFFGTRLPCVLQPAEEIDAEPVNPARVQYLLWTLYSELEPELILAPHHQDLVRLAVRIAEFLHERFAHLQFDSGVKTFLTQPNTYGWEVKKKLIWLGQHSYLFRLSFGNYVHAHGGKPDIPTLDDFLCQATTCWSGLGVIDMLAATLDLTASQRRDLRSWYERHAAYFRVVSVRAPFMEVVNLLNEQSYRVRVDEGASQFTRLRLVFGSLVPWEGEWYWSGGQQGFETVTDDVIQQIRHDFPLQAPQIVYRYCEQRAEQARAMVRKHYQQFLAYYGKDLVRYPDGHALAAEEQKFHRYLFASAPKEDVEAFLKRHHLSEPAPRIDLPPEILACANGIGVYCNPDEGQELMMGFDDVVQGFQKQGGELTEEEAESIRGFLYADAISPQFVRKLVHEYGAASIVAAFLIPRACDPYSLEYLLRRYKGHFYRNRYPSLTIVDT